MACEYGQGYCIRLSRKVGKKSSQRYTKVGSMARRGSNSAAEIVKGVICHGEGRTAHVEEKCVCCRVVKVGLMWKTLCNAVVSSCISN